MDILKTAREIGLFETAVNLSSVRDSAEVAEKAGAAMPLPDADIAERTMRAAQWLLRFGKRKYLFLTPEIALAEALAALDPGGAEAIIAIPCDMEEEARDRLRANLPDSIATAVLEEPYFPEGFFPGNGILVACGYAGGDRLMALPDTYRLVEHYSGFLGRKVFLPYVELDRAARYDGWMELNPLRFSAEWRDAA